MLGVAAKPNSTPVGSDLGVTTSQTQ